MKKQKKGFTLVEIMIVVAIIGLLAAIAIPSFINARTKTQTNSCMNNLRLIDGAIQQYALDHTNAVPADMGALVGTGAYIKDTPACPGGGTYTLGSLTTKSSCSVHGTIQ